MKYYVDKSELEVFYFNNVSNTNFNLIVEEIEGLYDSFERDIEFIEVPGRNGELIVDNNRFKSKNLIIKGYVDASNSISLESATVSSFGNFQSSGGKQDEYVANILEILRTQDPKSPLIKNGDIIDFNYGNNAFNREAGLYMYYEGKLYKVNGKKRSDANIVSGYRGTHTTEPKRLK